MKFLTFLKESWLYEWLIDNNFLDPLFIINSPPTQNKLYGISQKFDIIINVQNWIDKENEIKKMTKM
jgi:hypothetical protein